PSINMTPSCVDYNVIAEGDVEAVGDNGQAVVNYKGSLIDGTVFDQNDGITFSPKNVVPGFGEMLAQMKAGSHYVIMIPGNLAYGANGVPQAGIGPNATLIFDLEVTEVK
ncbi:MAG: FKBP-type peptidyl-prolyl cis-trans isomerase, partial [Duncaniella sp.]|nr:FKBP-type peptidyl-prolyl cis-trans isomerase [Duncaniella sp.]